MTTVYVVAYEEYDEFDIKAIFSTQEAADKMAAHNADWEVEKYELDPPILYARDGEAFYRLQYDDGYVWLMGSYSFMWPDDGMKLDTFHQGAFPNKNEPKRVSGNIYVCARDDQEAIAKMRVVLEAEGLPFVRMQNR